MRYDKVRYGYILGLLVPAFGLVAYALVVSNFLKPHFSFEYVLKHVIFGVRSNISRALTISLFANIGVFFLLDRWKMLKAMRGVVGALMTYGMVIVVLWLLWGRDFT